MSMYDGGHLKGVAFNLWEEHVTPRHLAAFLSILAGATNAAADSSTSTREFLDGKRQKFSTNGHPKARGVHLTIEYPSSWRAAEGERSGIVQKFVSEGGRGFEFVSVSISDLPLPTGTIFSEQDQQDFFSSSELRGMVPPGAIFINARATKIQAIPAGILEYRIRTERAGMSVLIQAWTLSFFSGNSLVQVQFMVAGEPGVDVDLTRRMAAFKPLFNLIATSIILPDNWSTAPKALGVGTPRQGSQATQSDDPPITMLTFVFSLIITWTIGLAPPLLVRHAIVRRPVPKRTAAWVAAGFSVFFFLSFSLLHFALGERPGRGGVWIVMFFVSTWIMSRGHVPAVPSPAALQPGPHSKPAQEQWPEFRA